MTDTTNSRKQRRETERAPREGTLKNVMVEAEKPGKNLRGLGKADSEDRPWTSH